MWCWTQLVYVDYVDWSWMGIWQAREFVGVPEMPQAHREEHGKTAQCDVRLAFCVRSLRFMSAPKNCSCDVAFQLVLNILTDDVCLKRMVWESFERKCLLRFNTRPYPYFFVNTFGTLLCLCAVLTIWRGIQRTYLQRVTFKTTSSVQIITRVQRCLFIESFSSCMNNDSSSSLFSWCHERNRPFHVVRVSEGVLAIRRQSKLRVGLSKQSDREVGLLDRNLRRWTAIRCLPRHQKLPKLSKMPRPLR